MYNKNNGNLIFNIFKNRVTAYILLFVFSVAVLGSLMFCNAAKTEKNNYEDNKVVFTSGKNTDEILFKTGITSVAANNLLNISASGLNWDIFSKNDINVKVQADGKKYELTTHICTVEQFLKNADISYDINDEITPSLETPIVSDITIIVNRVDYSTRVVIEEVPYSTIEEQDSTLALGSKTTKTKGVNGKSQNEYMNKFINGELSESTLISQDVITEPVNEIVIVGTKTEKTVSYNSSQLKTVSLLSPDIDIKLDQSGRPVNYKSVYKGTASAYSAKDGDHTATGQLAQVGYVAVDPKVIPYGSKLFIRTTDNTYIYGYAIAADTGGFVEWGTRLVDLYFSSVNECYQFGLRNVEVYVLE